MYDLLIGIAVMLIIEGVTYAAFPDLIKEVMNRIIHFNPSILRNIGMLLALLGVLIYYVVKRIF
jgi:uncharacterized protein YjeT (DUF2065 family)